MLASETTLFFTTKDVSYLSVTSSSTARESLAYWFEIGINGLNIDAIYFKEWSLGTINLTWPMYQMNQINLSNYCKGVYFLAMNASSSRLGQYFPISEYHVQQRVHPQPTGSCINAKEKYHNQFP